MSLDWRGSRVLVTGAGSGIGRALAEAAARRGAIVALVDVEGDAADVEAARLRETGADVRAYPCDVSDSVAMEGLAARISDELGGLEALFNNAGVGIGGPIDQISAADAAWVVSVNLFGVLNGIRAFTPLLRQAAAAGRPAWIVNTGSEHSLGIPPIGASNVYTTTKHALLGLTDVLRSDLEPSGIRAALLCPGLTATNIFDARRNRPDAFGGAVRTPPELQARGRAAMARGQDPDLTAELCFEGLDRGDFLIITDPNVRAFVSRRLAEIEAAVARVEERLRNGTDG